MSSKRWECGDEGLPTVDRYTCLGVDFSKDCKWVWIGKRASNTFRLASRHGENMQGRRIGRELAGSQGIGNSSEEISEISTREFAVH